MTLRRLAFPKCENARRRSRAITAIICAIALGTLAACGSQHDVRPHPEKATLRVGVQPLIDDAPLYIAQSKKLFSQAGLRVQLVPVGNDDDALAELKSGRVDVTLASDVGAIKAAVNGTNLEFEAEAYIAGTNSTAVVMPSNFKSADLSTTNNVVVAVGEANGLGTMATRARFATLGVDTSKVRFVTMPMQDIDRAIQAGTVTGGWLEEPYLTQSEQQHGGVTIDTGTGGQQNLPLSSYVSLRKFVNANPNTLKVFRSVLDRAQALAVNRYEVQQVLPQYCNVDKNAAALVSVGTFPTSLSIVRLQRVADHMHDAKLLSSQVDAKEFVDPVLTGVAFR